MLLPILKPLNVLFVLSVIVVPVLVKLGLVPLALGKVFENVGTVIPAKLDKVVVAPCPNTF